MTTTRDVHAKHREGKWEEAYQLAPRCMAATNTGEWDLIAFGWCLIDLIKRDAKAEEKGHLEHYRQQVDAIDSAGGLPWD